MIIINTKIIKAVVAASVLTAVAVPTSIIAFSSKNVDANKVDNIVEVETISVSTDADAEKDTVDNDIASVLNTTESSVITTTTVDTTSTKAKKSTETTVTTIASTSTSKRGTETTTVATAEKSGLSVNKTNTVPVVKAEAPVETEAVTEKHVVAEQPVQTEAVTEAVVVEQPVVTEQPVTTPATTTAKVETTVVETTTTAVVTEAPVVETEPVVVELKSVDEIAAEVLHGVWGNGADRKNALTAAGYDYDAVQAKVQELLAAAQPVVEVGTDPVNTGNLTWVKHFSRGTYYCYGVAKHGGSGRALIEGNTSGEIKGSIASSYLYNNYGYNYNGNRTTVYLEIDGYPEMNGYYYLDDCDAGNPNVIDFYYVYSSNCPFRNQGVVGVDCWIVG